MAEDVHSGDDDEGDDGDQLDEDDRGVEVGGLLDADDQDRRNDDDGEEGHEVEDGGGVLRGAGKLLGTPGGFRCPTAVHHRPLRAGDVAETGRQVDAIILEEGDQGGAPAGGDSGGAESVFEDQIPADDPGKDLAKRGVAVSVGRAGDGDHGGEFGIAQAGEGAAKSGDDVREHDSRAGILRGRLAGEHEDSGADDGADAQRYQVDGAERALQGVLAGLPRFTEQNIERLLFKQRISHAFSSGDAVWPPGAGRRVRSGIKPLI